MFAARRLALRAVPRRRFAAKKRDPRVERAVKEAAEQNSPLFGSSSLTLDNPWLWVAVARRAVSLGARREERLRLGARREERSCREERLRLGARREERPRLGARPSVPVERQ